jgi:hypothetical protein
LKSEIIRQKYREIRNSGSGAERRGEEEARLLERGKGVLDSSSRCRERKKKKIGK